MKSKEVKDLMEAYASIYMEQEQLVEGAEEYAGGQHPSKHPDKKVRDRYETETRRRQAPKGVGVPDKSVGYGQLQQSVDLFDIVKGYLIDEGATEEEVYDMMAHLTDEQRDAIVEERGPHYGLVGVPKKAIDKIPGVRALRTAASNTLHRMDYQHNAKPVQVGDKVVPYYMINPGGYGGGALSKGYRPAGRVTNLKSGKSKSMRQISDEL